MPHRVTSWFGVRCSTTAGLVQENKSEASAGSLHFPPPSDNNPICSAGQILERGTVGAWVRENKSEASAGRLGIPPNEEGEIGDNDVATELLVY